MFEVVQFWELRITNLKKFDVDLLFQIDGNYPKQLDCSNLCWKSSSENNKWHISAIVKPKPCFGINAFLKL